MSKPTMTPIVASPCLTLKTVPKATPAIGAFARDVDVCLTALEKVDVCNTCSLQVMLSVLLSFAKSREMASEEIMAAVFVACETNVGDVPEALERMRQRAERGEGGPGGGTVH